MPKRRKPALVWIHWLDSRQSTGHWRWVDGDDYQRASDCQSVGWIVHETKESYSLAQSLGDAKDSDHDVQCGGVMTIPKCCVQKIRVLRKGSRHS